MDASTWVFFLATTHERRLSSGQPDLPFPRTLCQTLACPGHTLPPSSSCASFVLYPHITALPVNDRESNQERFALNHFYTDAVKGLLCKSSEVFLQG